MVAGALRGRCNSTTPQPKFEPWNLVLDVGGDGRGQAALVRVEFQTGTAGPELSLEAKLESIRA